MTTRNKFSPEVRERALRRVGEHRADSGSVWVAMTSVAAKIGCTDRAAVSSSRPLG